MSHVCVSSCSSLEKLNSLQINQEFNLLVKRLRFYHNVKPDTITVEFKPALLLVFVFPRSSARCQCPKEISNVKIYTFFLISQDALLHFLIFFPVTVATAIVGQWGLILRDIPTHQGEVQSLQHCPCSIPHSRGDRLLYSQSFATVPASRAQ